MVEAAAAAPIKDGCRWGSEYAKLHDCMGVVSVRDGSWAQRLNYIKERS